MTDALYIQYFEQMTNTFKEKNETKQQLTQKQFKRQN